MQCIVHNVFCRERKLQSSLSIIVSFLKYFHVWVAVQRERKCTKILTVIILGL